MAAKTAGKPAQADVPAVFLFLKAMLVYLVDFGLMRVKLCFTRISAYLAKMSPELTTMFNKAFLKTKQQVLWLIQIVMIIPLYYNEWEQLECSNKSFLKEGKK
ncbi:hypothetical protein [Bacillus infantis]|uniref:hypothetical protein n=1 Tax=Bacillus infantis TaxID=324767 RepID=UPI003CF61AE0